MQETRREQAQRYRRRRQQKKFWRGVLSVMACIVVFCTTYALILPAITMEKEAFCGIEAHTHGPECYAEAPVTVCDPTGGTEMPVIHTHDALCYSGETLICTLPELAGHVHTDACYTQVTYEVHAHSEQCYAPERGALLCALAEEAGHSHGETCYVPGEVLLCAEEVREGHTHADTCYAVSSELTCATAEGEGHTHSDACYVAATQLGCGTEETAGHSHGEGCYDENGELICAEAEVPGHSHGEGCYITSQSLDCDIPEAPAHTHGEGCYTETKTLTCQIAEDPGHTHTGACYEQVLGCGLEEKEGHTHEDACFEMVPALACGKEERAEAATETVLSCGLTQIAPHIHNESCNDGNGTLVCTIVNAAVHQHTEECINMHPETEENLICALQVHEHTLACFSDPTADVETKEDWDDMIAKLDLSGNWREDVLTIAKSQLGYHESTKNYSVEEDGETMNGYTRYGAWYGVPYGDWCAMYASFCLHYANVPNVPVHSFCPTWVELLSEQGMFRARGEYTPKPGDLIFFDTHHDGTANHVGLVVEVEGDTVKTIEGNSGDTVRYDSYALTDTRIQGYGVLPAQYAEEAEEEGILYLCGQTEHIHTEECYDAEGNLVCGLSEHTHTEECMGRNLFYTDGQLRANVTIKGVAELPDDLSVEVWRITEEANPAAYDAMRSALVEKINQQDQYLSDASYYGMQLMSEGAVYELPETAEVSVSVEFAEPVFDGAASENAEDVKTFLLTPQETEEELAAAETEEAGISLLSLFSSDKAMDIQEDVAYRADAVEGEQYAGAETGLTGISFQTKTIATFAVTRASTVQEGTFWERITSTSQITDDGTYMIVSAEGNYALGANVTTSGGYRPTTTHSAVTTAVTLQTVKGNTRFYTITDNAGNTITGSNTDLCWTFDSGNNGYTITNNGSGSYLYLNSAVVSGSSGTMKLNYITPEYCWRIANGNNYLRHTGTGNFTYGSGNDGSGYGTLYDTITRYNSRDMLIFKLSNQISLNIPKDVATGTVDEGGTVVGPDRPEYDDFRDVSGAVIEAGAAVTKDDVTVSGKAWSDPATSQLESKFRPNVENLQSAAAYAASKVNDGKVMSDKSVIYRDDDYDAFSEYPINTFGVTLSALGQEYPVAYNDSVRTPLDVVFILDVSGSMTANKTSDGGTRMQALTDAFNDAATKILADNDENRIGVALYSTGAWEMLPLGRYKADYDENGIMQLTELKNVNLPYNSQKEFLIGSDSLWSTTENKSYADAGWTGGVGDDEDIHQGVGTYTQAGIQVGYNILAANEDTTYTVKVNEGTEVETYATVIRQPVIILLSDGEPTIATNNYMDPLSGPHYGSGNGDPHSSSSENNVNGAQGYYTVLSANYFKRMTGIHYNKSALFYTVGLGIKTPTDSNNDRGYDYNNNNAAAQDQGTGDAYKRAVLDPTPENINNAGSSINSTTKAVAEQFQTLMRSGSTAQAMLSQTEWPDPWTGVPHGYLPVLRTNPYASNYSYADESYFGKLSTAELTEIFTTIINKSQSETPYGFVLYKNTHVQIEDTLGEGMQIKGMPVLRYNGVNYRIDPEKPETGTITVDGNVTTYTYYGTYVDPYIDGREADLSEITVTVTNNSDGTQTVRLDVQDSVLPTYTPELIGKQYYYEALPVRLIYQVGLTEEAQQDVLNLAKTGGTLTYYTNYFYEQMVGDNRNVIPDARTYLLPSTQNPFYIPRGSAPYSPHTDTKTNNATNTAGYSTYCNWDDSSEGSSTYSVLHSLGNNGKLVFTAEKPSLEIPVEKKWVNVDDASNFSVDVTLYTVKETIAAGGATIKEILGEPVTVTLNSSNQFKHTFTELAELTDGTYYAIAETVPDGYAATYTGGELVDLPGTDGASFQAVKAVFAEGATVATAITVTNAPLVELPETGGPGTILYTIGGLLLMMAASILLLHSKAKKRRKEDPSSF